MALASLLLLVIRQNCKTYPHKKTFHITQILSNYNSVNGIHFYLKSNTNVDPSQLLQKYKM